MVSAAGANTVAAGTVAANTVAAVAVGERRFEVREFPLPALGETDGLLAVEASGVCGSDLKKYAVVGMKPTILGHETVGRVVAAGAIARAQWGVAEGDRVLLEEYLPCGHCAWCRSGEYRSCAETDNERSGALRYGSTPVTVPPALWGGYAGHQYLHLRSVLHPVPGHVPAAHATFAIPLSNGIQWCQLDAGVQPGDTVVVQGPGQQGIANLLAARSAGAERVVVAGLSRDGDRLDVARRLGADMTVEADVDDLAEVVLDITGGRGADVVVDCSGGGGMTLVSGARAVRKRGKLVAASGAAKSAPPAPPETLADVLALLRKKQLTVHGVRGHSYAAVHRAVDLIAGGTLPLELVCGEPYPLEEIDAALKAAAGGPDARSLHLSVRAVPAAPAAPAVPA